MGRLKQSIINKTGAFLCFKKWFNSWNRFQTSNPVRARFQKYGFKSDLKELASLISSGRLFERMKAVTEKTRSTLVLSQDCGTAERWLKNGSGSERNTPFQLRIRPPTRKKKSLITLSNIVYLNPWSYKYYRTQHVSYFCSQSYYTEHHSGSSGTCGWRPCFIQPMISAQYVVSGWCARCVLDHNCTIVLTKIYDQHKETFLRQQQNVKTLHLHHSAQQSLNVTVK